MKKDLVATCLLSIVGIVFAVNASRHTPSPKRVSSNQAINKQNTLNAAVSPSNIPVFFEQNKGQVDDKYRFIGRSNRFHMLMDDEGITLSPKYNSYNTSKSDTPVKFSFINRNKNHKISGINKHPGTANYIRKQRSITNIPLFEKVAYKSIFEGVDAVFYGNQRTTEFDFIVAPGVNPDKVRIKVQGDKGTSIDNDGNLIVAVNDHDKIIHRRPITYQVIAGTRKPVESRIVLDKATKEIAFAVGKYDRTKPLVIDPVLDYATYLGGSSTDDACSVAVDFSGNIYIIGRTQSIDFPLQSPIQGTNQGNRDIFVTKLNAAGSGILYSTYIGGSSDDYVRDVAVDSNGNAYICGYTTSSDFPVTPGCFQGTLGGGGGLLPSDAFVAKINSAGTALTYASYLGGSTEQDDAYAVTVNNAGEAYVVGETRSSDFPTASPLNGAPLGGIDGFITKVNSTGSSLLYSTYFGGGISDGIADVILDNIGNIVVAGYTNSTNFPTINALQTTFAGGNTDGFVSRIDASGATILSSTYIGGSNTDAVYSVALGNDNSIFVGGITQSTDFHNVSAFQTTIGGSTDGFVSRLAPNGSSLIYSSYLGGSSFDNVYGIVVDSENRVYATGSTASPNFPTQLALQPVKMNGFRAPYDAFLTAVSETGNALEYSSFYGGTGNDEAKGIALLAPKNVYIAGITGSNNLNLVNPVQSVNAGSSDGFAAHFSFSPSSQGTEFFVGFAKQDPDPGYESAWLHISSDQSTTGTITIPDITTPGSDLNIPFSVSSGGVTKVEIPPSNYSSVVTNGVGAVEYKKVQITSQSPVNVIAVHLDEYATDGTLCLPTSLLGKDHMVMSYKRTNLATNPQGIGLDSYFTIVATQDDTVVTITPSCRLFKDTSPGFYPKGVPITITLGKGQSTRFVDTFSQVIPDIPDVTGTTISASKPIAVYSGNMLANVPQSYKYANHLFEQIPPTGDWGTLYLTTTFAARVDRSGQPVGDRLRILSSSDNNVIRINGVQVTTLNKGKFYEAPILAPTVVSSDKPVLVGQFANSCEYDYPAFMGQGANALGDPTMIILPPVGRGLPSYKFATPEYPVTVPQQFTSHYINIIVRTDAISSMMLNNSGIPSGNFVPISNTGYSAARISIPAGTHTVLSNNGTTFTALSYGWGMTDAYGYALGL